MWSWLQLQHFQYAAVQCKGKHGHNVHQFLDTGDARSTSGLQWHAKQCWGDKTVNAADRTRDLAATCTILADSSLKRNGSITAAFECIRKSSITYSHHQLTYIETRYDLPLPLECNWHLLKQDWDCEMGHREKAALCDHWGPPVYILDKDWASRILFAVGADCC